MDWTVVVVILWQYLCNQCLSPLKLWGRIPLIGNRTRYIIMCQWFAIGRLFSPGSPTSLTNKMPRYNWNIVESEIKHYNRNPNPPKLTLYWHIRTIFCYVISPSCFHATWFYKFVIHWMHNTLQCICVVKERQTFIIRNTACHARYGRESDTVFNGSCIKNIPFIYWKRLCS